MNEKKVITEEIRSVHHDLDGPLSEGIKFLQNMLEQYPDAVLSWEEDRYYGDSYCLYLDNTRLETDSEFNARIKFEEDQAARMLMIKKAQLERLKKELGEK